MLKIGTIDVEDIARFVRYGFIIACVGRFWPGLSDGLFLVYNHCQNYLEHLTFCAMLFYFSIVFLNTTTSAPPFPPKQC